MLKCKLPVGLKSFLPKLSWKAIYDGGLFPEGPNNTQKIYVKTGNWRVEGSPGQVVTGGDPNLRYSGFESQRWMLDG